MILRPRRTRRVCWVLSAAMVVLFTALAFFLRGSTGDATGAVFQRGDQVAMVILGVLVAAGILLFTRPRVIADERHIVVRNIIGGYDLPWEIVRAVRFDRGSPWASLELADDDLISLLALQAVDKEQAVEGVRALRRLLAAHATPAAPDPAG